MPKARATERITKTLIFKTSICGEYYKGKLHDYIYMEDEEGHEYVFPAIVGSIVGGELQLSRSDTKYTMSFSPILTEKSKIFAIVFLLFPKEKLIT